jgi:hypothetical protein
MAAPNPSRATARQLKAVYAFMGPNVELERTLPLEPGETGMAEGRVRTRRRGLAQPIGYLRVSDRRVCIAEHHAFKADRILEVTRGSLLAVSVRGRWVRLRLRLQSGETQVSLQAFGPFVRRADCPSSPLKQAVRSWTEPGTPAEELSTALATWLERNSASV